MNGTLWDELWQSGGMRLIPAELCGRNHVGRARVFIVLSFLAANAGAHHESYWSPGGAAEALGPPFSRTEVRGAYAVITAAGL
jgi:hypothetical protein